MNLYKIRFNKTRGQPERGTINHVWRVFDQEREYLAKHVNLQVPSWSEIDQNGQDYNIVCRGHMLWFNDTDTAIITSDNR